MSEIVDTSNTEFNEFMHMPIVALRGLTVFPGMNLHFDVGRKKSIAALKNAMNNDQRIFLVAQKDAGVNEPELDDLYEVGVVCEIKQMIKIPNSPNLRVAVEGLCRGDLIAIIQPKPFLVGVINEIDEKIAPQTPENNAYARLLKDEFENYALKIAKVSNEVISKIISINEIGELADFICANTFFDYQDKQKILNEFDPQKRAEMLFTLLKNENLTLNIEAEIQEKVNKEVDKNQREYYLREEMKVIADQLGDGENPIEEADEYREKIDALKCSDEIKAVLYKECDKLMKMPLGSHEATVVRNYLDKCLEIPFGIYTKNSINLEKSRKILDKDHYGLDKVKTRIIESLAVYKRNPGYAGQIICLYGPPGVGKTSIVKSLAKSMNRNYVRVALGGIHDEAEIRGHRKTYIGAMTGRIIDALIKSGSMNPIILLDEIDKIGNDYKGDPSSALLEALDPEQNASFTDHYIDFPIDLSKVLFITTANDVSTVSAPYTADEKFNIAKKHLIKKELLKHNISPKEFKISDAALYRIIDCYTKEAGVRGLEKQISNLCRKAATALEEGETVFRVTPKNLNKYLGIEKYEKDLSLEKDTVGVVNGLAWTQVGGTMLPIEVSALKGTGKLELTGNLGDVMKESAKTAVSYIRYKSDEYGIDSDFYKTKDIHIHAPEAAISKDGPSAGLAITTAILSELTGIPIKANVAMTGEISLKGRALPIGGLKEKSMAAYKAGCDTVIIPKSNYKDLQEISSEVKQAVKFITVEYFDEILPIALTKIPKASLQHSATNDTVLKSSVITQ